MTAEDLLSVRNTTPFEPFRIILSDGRAYEIRHPELLFVGTTASIIGVPAPYGVLPDQFIRIANDHVTSTIPLEMADR